MDKIVSIDIETSSSDLDGVLLSIGLVKLDGRQDIYRQAKFRNGLFIKPESMKVNGITLDQLDDKTRPTLEEMDKEIAQWLDSDGSGDKWIPMGRGISYFDMKFVHRDLPRTFGKFGRRLFDITGFIFGLSQATGKSFYDIRSEAFDYATHMMKTEESIRGLAQHHALWDAVHNIHVMEYLKKMVGETKK